jgi:hypothetical protein
MKSFESLERKEKKLEQLECGKSFVEMTLK